MNGNLKKTIFKKISK